MKANLSGQNNIKTQPKNHFRNIAISITLIVLISIAGRFFGETWGYFAGNLDKQELIAFSAGEISGNSYHNDYIGLSFNLPENWCFRTDEEISALMNVQDVMYDKEFEHPKYEFVAFLKESSESISLSYTMGNYNNSIENYLNLTLDDIKKMYIDSGLKVDISSMDDVKLGNQVYKHADIFVYDTSSNILMCQSAYLSLIDNSLVTIAINSANKSNENYQKYFSQ